MRNGGRRGRSRGLTRRDTLKLSGLALGGLAVGGARAHAQCTPVGPCYPTSEKTHTYSLFGDLDELNHLDPAMALQPGEMRITFLGSNFPPPRRAGQEMSIFVEVLNTNGERDQFIVDCGSGVAANYAAMGIDFGRMDKVFLCHLHADHMNGLGHIYCFGPADNRKSPLYVWGPSASGVQSMRPPRRLYDDGTKAFCKNLREACRWHTESMSFLQTAYERPDLPTRQSWGLPHDPVPVGDDPPEDGYALVPIELNWKTVGGVAYDNPTTGVRITHFPVVHCRQGSIGYKLEWNGLTMVYTSDTKPETNCIAQAKNGTKGVDVFIHEMIVPQDVMVMKRLRLPQPLPYPGPDFWNDAIEQANTVYDSSHTTQGAFGHLLSRIEPHPRLAVATHFPAADDTIACALDSVKAHCPWVQQLGKVAVPGDGYITWSTDLMVLRVTKTAIKQLRGVVTDYAWPPVAFVTEQLAPPKYWKWGVDDNGNPAQVSDPRAQLDLTTVIEPGPDTYCADGY